MPTNFDPEEGEMLPVYEEHVDQDLTDAEEAEEHNAKVIDL